MKILAWELAPDNIRVNVVHPIGVNTDMSNNDWSVRWLGEHEDLAEPTRGNRMDPSNERRRNCRLLRNGKNASALY